MQPTLENIVESENIATAEEIYQVTLPDELATLANEYEETVDFRSRFLWKWAYTMVENVCLPTVPDKTREKVRQDKTIGILFTTLLDDFGERDGYETTFSEAKRIVARETRSPRRDLVENSQYVRYTAHVWDVLTGRLKQAPRYKQFEDIFYYDVQQAINSIEFSSVVNQNLAVANMIESMAYDSHNMWMFPMLDIDLMHSPSICDSDIGTLREVTDNLQKLARIGNWVTTWEREIDEGDFTAGVFAHALDSDTISLDEIRELRENPTEELKESVRKRIHDADVENELLEIWLDTYETLQQIDYSPLSTDPTEYITGMPTILAYHLASRGHK